MWTKENPPDYTAAYIARIDRLRAMRADRALLWGARQFYASHPVEFIEDWCETVDPRKAATGESTRMPFIMFAKQHELVRFLMECIEGETSGGIEKARDMGATWVCCAFSVWLWLFKSGAAVGWGSRKEMLVDRLGDMSSIFEKIRAIIRNLPREFMPAGFSYSDHCTYMKVINPETEATITGEAGDNIGRGGRNLIYFVDEAAHLERPDGIEAALADNTRTRIYISSVNGTGNLFHRLREGATVWPSREPARIPFFIMDWSDHPAKTREWYNARRQEAENNGLLHIFAQEVDRDYASAVDGIIIRPEWIRSAIDAHLVLPGLDSGGHIGSLDVADGGGDRNAWVCAKGSVIRAVDQWGAHDTGETARRALVYARNTLGPHEFMHWQYDGIGVGAGVKAEVNRLKNDSVVGPTLRMLTITPWLASASPLHKDRPIVRGDKRSPLAKDVFENLKAQAWWMVGRRFYLTHRAVLAARGEGEPVEWTPADVVSISSTVPLLHELVKELSQPVMTKSARLKMIVDKTPEGSRSPNIADAAIMTLFPVAGAGGLTIEQLRRVL